MKLLPFKALKEAMKDPFVKFIVEHRMNHPQVKRFAKKLSLRKEIK